MSRPRRVPPRRGYCVRSSERRLKRWRSPAGEERLDLGEPKPNRPALPSEEPITRKLAPLPPVQDGARRETEILAKLARGPSSLCTTETEQRRDGRVAKPPVPLQDPRLSRLDRLTDAVLEDDSRADRHDHAFTVRGA